jgi:hypothetical protein
VELGTKDLVRTSVGQESHGMLPNEGHQNDLIGTSRFINGRHYYSDLKFFFSLFKKEEHDGQATFSE